MGMPSLIVTAVLTEGRSKSEVARQYGVSRRWVITLVQRFLTEGEVGLAPRSRRPHHSPNQVAAAIEDQIVAIRKELDRDGHEAGAATIAYHLEQRQGRSPAISTIWRILTARGFVTPQPHKRPKSSYCRFQCEQPNEMWATDTTHWALADGTGVEISTSSTTTPGSAWPAPPGACSKPTTSTTTTSRPPASTAIPPPCCPTTAPSSPASPAAAAASPRDHPDLPRRPTRPHPALPPPDQRESRALPPNPQEVAAHPTTSPHPHPTTPPTRHIQGLLQQHPTPPRPRPTHPRPGLRSTTQSRTPPTQDRHRALADPPRHHRQERHGHPAPQQPPAPHRRRAPPRRHQSPHPGPRPRHPDHRPRHRRTAQRPRPEPSQGLPITAHTVNDVAGHL